MRDVFPITGGRAFGGLASFGVNGELRHVGVIWFVFHVLQLSTFVLDLHNKTCVAFVNL